MEALLAIERKKYHKALLEKGVLTIDKTASRAMPTNPPSYPSPLQME